MAGINTESQDPHVGGTLTDQLYREKFENSDEISTNWLGKTVSWLRSSPGTKVVAVALAILLTVSIVGIFPLILAAKEWKAQNDAEKQKVKPETPKTDETPKQPTTDESPKQPTTDETPKQPKTDETPKQPKTDETPKQPTTRSKDKKEKPEPKSDNCGLEYVQGLNRKRYGTGKKTKTARTYFDQQYPARVLDTQDKGDCGPDAVAQALSILRNEKITYADVRNRCAEYLKGLDQTDNWVRDRIGAGSAYTFEKLVNELGRTAETGDGQLPIWFDRLIFEIVAEVYQVNITGHDYRIMIHLNEDFTDIFEYSDDLDAAQREGRDVGQGNYDETISETMTKTAAAGKNYHVLLDDDDPQELITIMVKRKGAGFESVDNIDDWTVTPQGKPQGLSTIEVIGFMREANGHYLGLIPN